MLLSVSSLNILSAQETDTTSLSIHAYADAYYARFSDGRALGALQSYTTVSPRHNQWSLNMAEIGVHYSSPWVRGNVTIHHGDIVAATWSTRFPALQEANVGVLLADDLWLDMGFFHTHIGTESFLPRKNLLSSTAVATFNEPFYQAGAKLSYEGWENWTAELWIVNGYNLFSDVNSAKSIGALISYQINENTSVTYTNLFGRESEDDLLIDQFRSYHNLYLNMDLANGGSLIIGGDYGRQTNTPFDPLSSVIEDATMYNALLIYRQPIADKYSATFRAEVFNDPDGFISGVVAAPNFNPRGLEMIGLTLGVEYKPSADSYLRIESRWIQTPEELEFFNSDPSNQRLEGMITAGMYIEHRVMEKVHRF